MIDSSYVYPSGTNAGLTTAEVFCNQLQVSGDCVEWNGKMFSNGYGCFIYKGRYLLAHRAAWALGYGESPKGQCLMHSCDNRKCVNLEHLREGTAKENYNDCATKGRDNKAVGEAAGRASISSSTAVSIYNSEGLYSEIADKHNTTEKVVAKIKGGWTWSHVTGAEKKLWKKRNSATS